MSETTLVKKGWHSNCQQVTQTDDQNRDVFFLWGESEQKGTPYIQVAITVEGKVLRQRLYLSPGAKPYTAKKIRAMGWHSNDWNDIEEHAHGKACLSVKVEHETYKNDDGEVFVAEQIAFITDKGGRSVTPMSKDSRRSFIAELNAGMSSAEQSSDKTAPDDDLPF